MDHRTRRISRLLAATLALAAAAGPAAAYDDGHGREWRELVQTSGLTWTQIAQVCPQDGATPCAGTAGGRRFDTWVWATQEQVMELMNRFLFPNPALPNGGFLSVEHPGVGGWDYWFAAQSFPFAPTYSFTMNGAPYLSSSAITGWTATRTSGGLAILGHVGWGNSPVSIEGGFGAGAAVDPSAPQSPPAGVWLWRPIGPDDSPPSVTPNAAGTLGHDGWYVSDVTLGWTVADADSTLVAASGCDPVVVATDTAGDSFTCSATSEGGTASASVTIRRDATPPTITCGSNVFPLGQPLAQVTANVEDDLSGPTVPSVFAAARTATAGTFSATLVAADRAGNRATLACPYRVVVPKCHGLVPTQVGTGGNDTIHGTEGPDVIHALAGNDFVYGLGGDDVVCGGDGNDDLDGGAGDDDLDGGTGSDSIRGGGDTDNCASGEVRMSNCDTYEPYRSDARCGFGAEIAAALGAIARLRRRAGLSRAA